MSNGWVHAVIDFVAYGRPYFDVHKEKDKPYEFLGSNHRIVNHDLYQAYRSSWDFNEPFPSWIKESIRIIRNEEGRGKAEEQMAWIDHDYIDRTWDVLSVQERKYWEGFLAWVLRSPKILKEWAGVDVLSGRIQRTIDDHEVWEYCPELKFEYLNLRKYVEAVKKNDKILQDTINHYGNNEYIPDCS